MPKTGGTTLNEVVRGQYESDRIFDLSDVVLSRYGKEWKHVPNKERWKTSRRAFIDLSESKKLKLDAVIGHLWFGVHDYTDVPCQYVTFIRHPVRRYISYFNFIHGLDGHSPTEEVRKHDLSLAAFLEKRSLSKTAENQQVKFLTGDFSPDVESLERALENIDGCFLHVGLTERFDRNLIQIAESLGWDIPLYTRRNVSEKKTKVSELDPLVMNEIISRNELDMALYECIRSQCSERTKVKTGLFRIVNYLRDTSLGRSVSSLKIAPIYEYI